MGLSGVSPWELLIILLIVVMLFGTKHLKTLGGDLGGAIRGFRKAMEGKEPKEPAANPMITEQSGGPPTAPAETPQRAAQGTAER